MSSQRLKIGERVRVAMLIQKFHDDGKLVSMKMSEIVAEVQKIKPEVTARQVQAIVVGMKLVYATSKPNTPVLFPGAVTRPDFDKAITEIQTQLQELREQLNLLGIAVRTLGSRVP